MCCRLRLDTSQLRKRGGGLFGSNPLTGSIGVFTINLPRLAYLSKSKREFMARLRQMAETGRTALEIKRKIIERQSDKELYPYSCFYLRHAKERTGHYWHNHFSTIGIVGMHEALLNFMGRGIATRQRYGSIITAGDKTPYYSNSTQLPVGYTEDIFEVLELQDDLQSLYTGGTVQHLYLGEAVEDIEASKRLIQKIFSNYKIPDGE